MRLVGDFLAGNQTVEPPSAFNSYQESTDGDNIKYIPAQWAKIKYGRDIIRISSKYVYSSLGEVQENLTVPFLRK